MQQFVRVKILNKAQYLIINLKHIRYIYQTSNTKGVKKFNIVLNQQGFDPNGLFNILIDEKTYDQLIKRIDYFDLVDEF